MCRRWFVVCVCVASLCLAERSLSSTVQAADEPVLPKVPEGFEVELVAAAPVVERPVMANFDERGRLFVVDSAGANDPFDKLKLAPPHRVVMLEDTDQDGKYDKRTVFADKLVMPQGVLPYRGAVYVASPPSVWKLEDTDQDGVADRRTELVTSFGSNGNAADIHGPTLGPDGRLYLCDGRHGHKVTLRDGTIDQGLAAGIFRFRTDGSAFERICGGGFDNPVEIAFLPDGDLVGTVNLLHGNPRQDCLMHWVEGGCYPRADQGQCLAEFQRTGDLLPAITELGHVAVSGMMRVDGETLGSEYQGSLFITLFNLHKVIRSVVEPNGSSFKWREEEFLVSDQNDFHPTDVLEDPSGGLLVINTGGWFRIGCPTSQVAKPDILGGIYRVRRKNTVPVADPVGKTLQLSQSSPAELRLWLDDSRPLVRARAIDELALRGTAAIAPLTELVSARTRMWSVPARLGAVWAAIRIADQSQLQQEERQFAKGAAANNESANDALKEADRIAITQVTELLLKAVRDPDPGVRKVAAHGLGMLKLHAGVESLCERVASDQPDVQRVAATALGRILAKSQSSEVVHAVGSLLSPFQHAAPDRMLEHSLLFALIRIQATQLLQLSLGAVEHPLVQRGALLSLQALQGKTLSPELVTPLLASEHEGLRTTALLILSEHPQKGQALTDLIRGWITSSELSEERQEVLRGVLLAQLKDAQIQAVVTAGLQSPTTSSATRQLLWDTIHQSTIDPLPVEWKQQIKTVLESADSADRPRVLSILQDKASPELDPLLLQMARNDAQPAAVRVMALSVALPRQNQVEAWMFDLLSQALVAEQSPIVSLTWARSLGDSSLSNPQLLALTQILPKLGPLAAARILKAFRKSQDEAVGLALVSALNNTAVNESEIARELTEILSGYPQTVRRAADGLLARLQSGDSADQKAKLASLVAVLTGGDAGRGKSLFFSQKAACSGCHAVSAMGGRVGPDLTKISTIRNGGDLLEAVVLPSASFARDFRPYTVTTNAGKVFVGVITRQTPDAIVLRTADLAELRIPRDRIDELVESKTSIMPKGIETTLTTDELRDLMAYLQTLK